MLAFITQKQYSKSIFEEGISNVGSYKHKMTAPNSAYLSRSQAKTFRFTIF